MARTIYWTILVLSVLIGIYFYGIVPQKYDPQFLVYFSLLPFFMFAGSVHGLIAHLLKPNMKGGLIFYPVFMGALFTLFLLIHVYLVIPLVCPDF